MIWVQRLLIAWQQYVWCWHVWRPLKWHGLPNEPVLRICAQCNLIAGAQASRRFSERADV